MTCTTAARPIEPQGSPEPEQFGLTQGRVNRFQNSPFRTASVLLAIPAAILIVAKSLKLIGVSRLWLLFPFTWYVVGGIVAGIAGLYKIADAAWLRRQPDAEAYQRYAKELKLYCLSLKVYREQLDSWQRTQLAWWRKLSGGGFERELARLLQARGYHVKLMPATKDGGVDLILQKDSQSILVQCKAHKNRVGPGPVRDLFGTLTHQGGTAAWLVATSSFTKGAATFARGKPIRLVLVEDLLMEHWNRKE